MVSILLAIAFAFASCGSAGEKAKTEKAEVEFEQAVKDTCQHAVKDTCQHAAKDTCATAHAEKAEDYDHDHEKSEE